MALMNLRNFATMLAMYVQKNMGTMNRGAMLIRCVNDGSMVAAVFGNDNFAGDTNTRHEVELVRRELVGKAIEELGFGLTPDGNTWTLLVRADNARYHTSAGKAFHMEMFRIFLEDTVQGAWSSAAGITFDDRMRLSVEYRQPLPKTGS
jgi:hypothetical protein